jgi:hypothetical protein
MAKRDEWLRELGPDSFFSQPKLEYPKWTGSLPVSPGYLFGEITPKAAQEHAHAIEEFNRRMLEFGREMQDHNDECDRIKKEFLIREWCEFLGTENPVDALWKLGEK